MTETKRTRRTVSRGKLNRNGLPKLATHQGGPAASKTAKRRAREEPDRLELQRRAYNDYVTTADTYDELGRKYGVSDKTAWEWVDAHRRRLIDAGLAEDVELMRARIAGIYRRIAQAHLPHAVRAKSPSREHAKVVMEATRDMTSLMGLRKEREPGGDYTPERVGAMFLAFTQGLLQAFAAAEDRRRILAVVDQVAPQFLPAGEGGQ